jgi:hypothetical protein
MPLYGGSPGKVNYGVHAAAVMAATAPDVNVQNPRRRRANARRGPGAEESDGYLMAPTVNPAMKRSTKKL